MTGRQLKYIYWFAYYNNDSPSVKYRAQYPLDFAREKLGMASCLVMPGYSPKMLLNFIQAYLSALLFPKKGAIIVIQRVNSNFIYANLLKLLVILRRPRTVYDLDDAKYLEHDPKGIHFFARNCNYISAGSGEIAKYLRQFNRNVYHITSPVPDLGIFKQEKSETFTIGWIGGFSWGHQDSLYQYVFPAIKALPFKCVFVLMGVMKPTDENEISAYFKGATHVKLVIPKDIDWKHETALQNKIKAFDVGVATLLNHPVQLAKSGIKAKQYMNNGVPVLCNDLPENNNIVINEHNGLICNSSAEFRQAIIRFREMHEDAYMKFSTNARLSAKNFNHYRYFENFEKIKMAYDNAYNNG